MSAAFRIEGVSKGFSSLAGGTVHALAGLNIEAPAGEITCLVGPTGSGKSTVLRLLAGLDAQDEGLVQVEGRPPGEKVGQVALVTQLHNLMPWKRTWENIVLPDLLRGLKRREARARALALCSSMGLEGSGELYPYELSGGMIQRAALARQIAADSRLWLLDEPFSSLDERTQHALQDLLISLVAEKGLSVVFVTHSIDEAVYLADRVEVLSAVPGRVIESFRPALGRPRDRLSPGYGEAMERVRRSIESVL
jgi:NitT/TauT family transport system ATP-binding protein